MRRRRTVQTPCSRTYERAAVTNFLEAAFDQARLNGLPKRHWKRYRKLIFVTYFHVFRTRLGREAPALLPAMKVEVYPGAELKQGYKISFDKLTAPQLEQMRVELDRNKDMGVLGDAPLGAILHAMLTILKQDGSMRWVIACMTANDIIRPMWWDQPDNATSQQQRMRGAKYYWLADMLKGYWQLELHPDSRWLFCFATPWGPMMYLRAPMGCKITAPWFCMCMARVLDAAGLLHRGVEMIQDDHGGHADVIYDDDPNGRSHYHLLRRYLKVCAQHRLRISPKKFTLFAREADIGGALHKEGGMTPNPARYQAIIEQPEPKTLDTVYSAMAAIGWNRSYIPNFAVIEQPVRAFVMAKLGAGRKSKQRAKRIKLTPESGWNDDLRKAFKRLKYALVRAIKRAYRDPRMIACLLWDASKFAWSYTITQVHPEELAKAWEDQCHQILVTRSGLFKGAQLDWHPGCKEAYPPMRALECDSQFLVGEHPFMAAGDHRNIVYIMHKKKRPQILKQTSHDRLNRWCLKWAHANFQIYHVPGISNAYNDFHSRAGAPEGEAFYTLKDHERRLVAKEKALRDDAECSTSDSEEDHANDSTAVDAAVADLKEHNHTDTCTHAQPSGGGADGGAGDGAATPVDHRANA